MTLGVRHQRPDLGQKVSAQWVKRLKEDTSTSISFALEIAERLGDMKLLGEAYYIAMLRASSLPDENSRMALCVPVLRFSPRLSSDQELRIQRGILSMTLLWGYITKTHLHYVNPKLNRPPSISADRPKRATVFGGNGLWSQFEHDKVEARQPYFIEPEADVKPMEAVPMDLENKLLKLPCTDILGKLSLILDQKRTWETLEVKDRAGLQRLYDFHSKNLHLHFVGTA